MDGIMPFFKVKRGKNDVIGEKKSSFGKNIFSCSLSLSLSSVTPPQTTPSLFGKKKTLVTNLFSL